MHQRRPESGVLRRIEQILTLAGIILQVEQLPPRPVPIHRHLVARIDACAPVRPRDEEVWGRPHLYSAPAAGASGDSEQFRRQSRIPRPSVDPTVETRLSE